MKFADFILPDAVSAEVKAVNKQGVIREMVQSLLDANGIKKEAYETIVRAINKYEEHGSIEIGRGIAVFKTRHYCVERLVGCVAVCAEGIDFDRLDCEKVFLFFLLVSPPSFSGDTLDYLRALEHITRQLKDDTFCQFLKQSKTKEEILSVLEEADNNRVK
jgi:PTS system fructose-specific IIA component/PTS system nitrogen regulatory IIA component